MHKSSLLSSFLSCQPEKMIPKRLKSKLHSDSGTNKRMQANSLALINEHTIIECVPSSETLCYALLEVQSQRYIK